VKRPQHSMTVDLKKLHIPQLGGVKSGGWRTWAATLLEVTLRTQVLGKAVTSRSACARTHTVGAQGFARQHWVGGLPATSQPCDREVFMQAAFCTCLEEVHPGRPPAAVGGASSAADVTSHRVRLLHVAVRIRGADGQRLQSTQQKVLVGAHGFKRSQLQLDVDVAHKLF
jgi:hypothetical protein